MTFEHEGLAFNLLDTPGHEDFSEDTYRTLTAVDSAVMVIDAAKGIETQTRKLFEVCRLRDVPIMTFINKVDREGRDPFELLDEIAGHPGARRRPGDLAGRHGRRCSTAVYDLRADRLLLPVGKRGGAASALDAAPGLDDPALEQRVAAADAGRASARRPSWRCAAYAGARPRRLIARAT